MEQNEIIKALKEIILVNKVISEAVIHGADLGGSYNSNEDGLTEAINEWLEYKNLHHLYCVEIRDVCKDFGYRSEMWSVPQICEKTEIKGDSSSKFVAFKQSRNYGKHYELAKKIKMISDEIKADAVKEIQTMLAMHFGTYTDTDTVKVVDVFKLLTQIEKEMSEEGGG